MGGPSLLLGSPKAERTLWKLGLLCFWGQRGGGHGEMLSEVKCRLNGQLL